MIPRSTYRLQIREGFDLHAAADLVPYLHALGADWVYLSPLLVASAGSDHGYDVIDHSTIDPARGGPAGLDALSTAAHGADMGVLVDIVPNHVGVAVPKENRWWWDLLAHGQQSRYAEAFDVDWAFAPRLRIPVLGSDATLTVVDGELDYFGTRFPIAPGSEGGTPEEVHDRQHYELVDWRRADAELNYRRFFAVNSLAAIRVEVPWVFDQSHTEIGRWFAEGLVDGLRVDHPDGLLNPGEYLDDLARLTGSAYVLVEKILEGHERLPAHWQAAGTTGYDALADIDRILVDPAGRVALDDLDARLHGGAVAWADLIHETRRGIADGILRSEVLRIARLVPDIEPADGPPLAGSVASRSDVAAERVGDGIAELCACFPVYRSYLPYGVEHLEQAAADAARRRPELAPTIDALVDVLRDPGHPAALRMQQTTGMVMAKGVEDTAFYRTSRLASLTEVGADPDEFSIDLREFHRRQEERHGTFPASQTALSTHDTKRGEDVRARIDVLSEVPQRWLATITRIRELVPLGDGPFENLLWESVVGAWPASAQRLHAYAEKASREAGTATGWAAPNTEFEAGMHAAIDRLFEPGELRDAVEDIVEVVRMPGWSNSLAAKLIQLTAPGVPDVYQGSELWETSLVDPDNRREVDFDHRLRILQSIDDGALPEIDETGAAKLLVTTRALRLRRDRPELFTRYAALTAVGPAAGHLIAFDRGGAVTLATRLPVGLAARGGWADTVVLLPGRPVTDVLTGATLPGGALRVADVLHRYPVGLLAS